MAEKNNIEEQNQGQQQHEVVNQNVPETTNTTENIVDNVEHTTTHNTQENNISDNNDTIKIKNNTNEKKSLEEILSEHGYIEEIDVIKQHREAKTKEQLEKEKPFQETKEFADVVKFASENKLATLEDFKTFDKIKAKKDEDIAFEQFKNSYTPDEFEEEMSQEELSEIIKEKFETKYHINSDDEELKSFGAKKLSEIAGSIKKPFIEKIETVQNSIIANQMYQSHLTAIDEFNKNLPKQSVIIKDIEGNEIAIEVENTDTIDSKEVQKILKETDEGRLALNTLFDTYKKDKSKADEAFGQFLTSIYTKNAQQKILENIASSAYEKGLEKGKSMGVGHIAPFNSKKAEDNIITNHKTAKVNQYEGEY